MKYLQRVEQIAIAQLWRIGKQQAPVTIRPAADFAEALVQAIGQLQMHRARRRKITLVGVVRAFLVLQAADDVGNQEIQVAVALPVAMRALVDRHAVDGDREIGAVIEVDAAQKILVGFAFAALLGDDDAGGRFQNFARPVIGARLDLLAAHGALARRIGGAQQVVGGIDDFHRVQRLHARRDCRGYATRARQQYQAAGRKTRLAIDPGAHG